MTFKQAQAFVEQWQPILAPEWDVKVEDGPSPHWAANEHVAATRTSGNYLRATIHVNEVTAGDLGDAEGRQTLLHELLHLTVFDLRESRERADQGALSRRLPHRTGTTGQLRGAYRRSTGHGLRGSHPLTWQ